MSSAMKFVLFFFLSFSFLRLIVRSRNMAERSLRKGSDKGNTSSLNTSPETSRLDNVDQESSSALSTDITATARSGITEEAATRIPGSATAPANVPSAVPGIAATQAQPTLLGVPLEIRNNIYRHFLKADIDGDYPITDSCLVFHFKICWINQKLRKEALEYLCTRNHWIQIGFYVHKHQPIPNNINDAPPPFTIPTSVFPAPLVATLLQNQALTLRVGFGCGRPKPHADAKLFRRFLFAYNRSVWFDLCDPRVYFRAFDSHMSIDLGSRYQVGNDYTNLMPGLLLPLASIQGIHGARFTKMIHVPVLDRIATSMSKARDRPEDLHEFILGIKEVGDHYAVCGRPWMSRTWHSRVGEHGARTNRDIVNGHPQWAMNRLGIRALLNTGSDIMIATTAVRMQQVELQKKNGEFPPDVLNDIRALDEMIAQGFSARGATIRQRMQLHYYYGLNMHHSAIYVKDTENYERSDKFLEKAGLPRRPQDQQLRHFTVKAAGELFFATELDSDRTTEIGQKAKQLFDELVPVVTSCNMTEELNDYTRIVSFDDLLGYGRWRGSAIVAQKLRLDPGMALYMHTNTGLVTKTEEELERVRVNLGLPDKIVPLSLLRFIAD